MRSPQPSTVVIACPHCGTRYQVPPETLGDQGRKVSCAHCGKAWLAEAPAPAPAEDDRLFTPVEEEALDREFVALEQRAAIAEVPNPLKKLIPKGETPPPEVMKSIAEIKAAIAPKAPEAAATPEPVEHKPTPADKAAKGRFDKRQQAVGHGLPSARLFRGIRLGALGLLVVMVGGGVWFRTEIVRMVPDMAGLYSAIGLGVNVVGLEFTEVSTLMTRRGDSPVITVTAKIHAVEPRRVRVPAVVVSLLDEHGTSLYQWSVMPKAADVEPGEAIEFSAELASPPKGATQLRLSFVDGRPPGEAATSQLPTPEPSSETQH